MLTSDRFLYPGPVTGYKPVSDVRVALLEVAKSFGVVAEYAVGGKGYGPYITEIEQVVRADVGRLFVLDLANATYIQDAPKDKVLAPIPADPIIDLRRTGERRDTIFAAITDWRDSTGHPVDRGHCIIAPLMRNQIIGFLLLEREAHRPPFDSFDRALAEALAPGLVWLKERQQALDVFNEIQQPIDYLQSTDSYFKDLIDQVALASAMPLVAIRQYDSDEGTLRCIASYGFEQTTSEQLDLNPVENFPTFAKAIREKKSIAEYDMTAKHLVSLVAQAHLKHLKSFIVVPILVGKETFGTVSFACSVKYEFTALEMAVFETIANGVGVSIRNFQSVRASESSASEKARKSMAFTAVEIAQIARHESVMFLENIKTLLGMMSTKLSPQQKEIMVLVNENVDSTLTAINRIKNVTKPPKKELTTRKLKEMWVEVFAEVKAKLEMEDISCVVVGKDNIEAWVYPDHLRNAFVNLLLNSIDAYSLLKRKSGRKIIVELLTPSQNANKIEMTYTDNAGGIDPSKLIIPEEFRHIRGSEGVEPSPGLIFGEGVTSKPNGGGYGMWLTQKILDEHSGSIDLISHRGGVQFKLSISKQLLDDK